MNDAYEKLIQHFDANEIRYLTSGDSQTVWVRFPRARSVCIVLSQRSMRTDGLFQVFELLAGLCAGGFEAGSRRDTVRANSA